MKSTDSVIVSWDFSRGKDVGVLIVGSQKNGRVDVINAYQGKEAYELLSIYVVILELHFDVETYIKWQG